MEQKKVKLDRNELEINKLEIEIKTKKIETFLSFTKVILLLLGGVIALLTFLYITNPESTINRKKISEEIANDRAITLLDKIFSIKDPIELELSYELFKNTFKEKINDKWFSKLDSLVQDKIDTLYALIDLRRQKEELIETISKLDPKLNAKQYNLIEKQIKLIEETIQDRD